MIAKPLNLTASPTTVEEDVDGTKIELTGNAHGDIMYYDGTDWVKLAAVEGCYLQSNGSGAAPTWVSNSTLAIALG